MLKSFTFSLLSIMLVVSILAPSIEALCKSGYDKTFVMDLNEEEKSNQEAEKKFDQKELFITTAFENNNFLPTLEVTKSQISLVSYSGFSAEIFLPPPENLI